MPVNVRERHPGGDEEIELKQNKTQIFQEANLGSPRMKVVYVINI